MVSHTANIMNDYLKKYNLKQYFLYVLSAKNLQPDEKKEKI